MAERGLGMKRFDGLPISVGVPDAFAVRTDGDHAVQGLVLGEASGKAIVLFNQGLVGADQLQL